MSSRRDDAPVPPLRPRAPWVAGFQVGEWVRVEGIRGGRFRCIGFFEDADGLVAEVVGGKAGHEAVRVFPVERLRPAPPARSTAGTRP